MGAKKQKADRDNQLAFAFKRFTLDRLIYAKLDKLAEHLDKLTHSDLVWLSRVEDFFIKYEYVTERQVAVIDSILNRANKESLIDSL